MNRDPPAAVHIDGMTDEQIQDSDVWPHLIFGKLADMIPYL